MPHPLHSLFYPKHLAVVGASDRYGSIGRSVFSLLCTQTAAEQVLPVNANHKTVGGRKAYTGLAEAVSDYPVDTAVIVLSADKIGSVVRDAAKAGIKQLILINELEQPTAAVSSRLERAAAQAEKSHIRLLSVPLSGLSGMFGLNTSATCSYIGQSVDIADCMATYTASRGISFSRLLTVNPKGSNVTTGQIIDFAVSEPHTKALFVHISTLDNARKLLSALTAASRRMPVVVLSTLSDAEQEMLFAQAMKRRHILSVDTLTQFCTAAKLVHTGIGARGGRLAVISNTPQISTLSLKTLPQIGLKMAELSAHTQRTLSKLLPQKTDSYHPIHLNTDTVPGIFQAAVSACLHDENTDAVCLIYNGKNHTESLQTAQMVSVLQAKSRKPLLLVWLGSAEHETIRRLFRQQNNLHFSQPEHAQRALAQLVLYRNHQQNRHRFGLFHDYRRLSPIVKTLAKNLKPLLPVALLPAGQTNNNHLLEALGLTKNPRLPPKQPLDLQWEYVKHFGQVLSLKTDAAQVRLLLPLNPEIVGEALETLQADKAVWRDFLLDCSEILSRQPEIHSVQVQLDIADKKPVCRELKLHLQDADMVSGSLSESLKLTLPQNIFAPIPHETGQDIRLKNGEILRLRPIRPEDAQLIRQLIAGLSEESRYTRFMNRAETPSPAVLSRLANPDYQRDFAVLLHDDSNTPLATANYIADPDTTVCEFGISIADHLQGQGLGVSLMQILIEHARTQGYTGIRAEILADNHPMQKLALKLGFTLSKHPDDHSMVSAYLALKA